MNMIGVMTKLLFLGEQYYKQSNDGKIPEYIQLCASGGQRSETMKIGRGQNRCFASDTKRLW